MPKEREMQDQDSPWRVNSEGQRTITVPAPGEPGSPKGEASAEATGGGGTALQRRAADMAGTESRPSLGGKPRGAKKHGPTRKKASAKGRVSTASKKASGRAGAKTGGGRKVAKTATKRKGKGKATTLRGVKHKVRAGAGKTRKRNQKRPQLR